MLAQYYSDEEEVVRIFSYPEGQGIMNCLMFENSLKEADRAIKKCGLKRKEKWSKRKWGFETRVSFRN